MIGLLHALACALVLLHWNDETIAHKVRLPFCLWHRLVLYRATIALAGIARLTFATPKFKILKSKEYLKSIQDSINKGGNLRDRWPPHPSITQPHLYTTHTVQTIQPTRSHIPLICQTTPIAIISLSFSNPSHTSQCLTSPLNTRKPVVLKRNWAEVASTVS